MTCYACGGDLCSEYECHNEECKAYLEKSKCDCD